MIIDFLLLAVFLGSLAASLWLVLRKIPLLLAVPENLIRESFVTRPSRLKVYTRPLVAFFEEERYKDIYYALLVRVLRRVRVTLLRLERISFHLLQSLQAREKELSDTEEHYWQELRRWKHAMKKNGNSLPQEVLNPGPPVESPKDQMPG